jgi:hypothetical protein
MYDGGGVGRAGVVVNDGTATSFYHKWDEDQLAQYLTQHSLGQYAETFKHHKINGAIAPYIKDSDLKDMQITIVGDRLRIQRCLAELKSQARFHKRIQSLWEGQERLFYGNFDKNVGTCCGFCPVDPSTYRLTTNHLKVKKVRPVRCGPCVLGCFGATYVNNNIDLSKVDDVDVFGIPAPCIQRTCCCAKGKDIVEVESRFEKGAKGGCKIQLVLEEGHGEIVSNLILNQVEESQKMERS